jgi:diacylglycerol kinase
LRRLTKTNDKKMICTMMKLPRKYVRYNPFRSIKYALFGIKDGFSRELNLVIQLMIGLVCIGFSFYFRQWNFGFLHIVMMGITISFELMNTAFETLCDVVKLEYDERIKIVKDMAAGSVLVASLSWLAVIVFEIFVVVMR